MSVTDGIGQTPCSLEHYLVPITFRYHFCRPQFAVGASC